MNRMNLKILTVLPLLHRPEITIRFPFVVRCVVHPYFDEFRKTYNQLKLLKFVISCHNSCHPVCLFFAWLIMRRFFFFFLFFWNRMDRLRDFLHDMLVSNHSLTSLAKIDIAFSAVESGSYNVSCTAVVARHVQRDRS
jgi:hypothetical protein